MHNKRILQRYGLAYPIKLRSEEFNKVKCICSPGPPVLQCTTDSLSAFRATKGVSQPIFANTESKILFELEEFDTNNEYDSLTSTFIPNQSGIYTINASSLILEALALPLASVNMFIRVNSVNRSASKNTGFDNEGGITVSATSILSLNAGDKVEVFISSQLNGSIAGIDIPGYTHFQAVRTPD